MPEFYHNRCAEMDVIDVLDGIQDVKPHHKQDEFCFTRPDYRATGNETAVKVSI